jgi:hypothetical protein
MRKAHPTHGSVGKQQRHVVLCDCDSHELRLPIGMLTSTERERHTMSIVPP